MNEVLVLLQAVEDRLKRLGLSREPLALAVSAGTLGWLNCSDNHPPSFRGINAWAETVRVLREGTSPTGWEKLNDRNLPLTVHRENKVAVLVSSGDSCTGIEHQSPRTRNPKGCTTREKVEDNSRQLELFSDMTVSKQEVDDLLIEVEKWDTWLLLSYRDYGSRVVRSELSKPINVGSDGRVDGWSERIILPEIPFDGDEVFLKRGGNDNGGSSSLEFGDQFGEIDVPVKRRA